MASGRPVGLQSGDRYILSLEILRHGMAWHRDVVGGHGAWRTMNDPIYPPDASACAWQCMLV